MQRVEWELEARKGSEAEKEVKGKQLADGGTPTRDALATRPHPMMIPINPVENLASALVCCRESEQTQVCRDVVSSPDGLQSMHSKLASAQEANGTGYCF